MYLHPLMAVVPPSERAAFVAQIELRSYRRGEIVLSQDEWTDQLYCVASGLLRAVVQGSEDGGDVTTDFIRRDDFFLSPTLQENRYQAGATLVAALPASVYLVPVSALRELCTKYPEVTRGMLELVMKRAALLRRQLRQIASSSTERLVSRILHELTELAPVGGGGYDKRISQSVIASYSGLSREQVNKTMRGLEGRGLVTRDEHAVHVPAHFAASDFQGLLPIEVSLAKTAPRQAMRAF